MEKFSLNMFTYFPSSLLVLWSVRHYHLTDIHSIAYPNIFNQNHNGLLIVDQYGYLVDFNPAAEKFLSALILLKLVGHVTRGYPFLG